MDDLLAATAAAAKSDSDPSAFYSILIDCAMRALGGVAAAVWMPGSDANAAPICLRTPDVQNDAATIATLDGNLISWIARQNSPGVLDARTRVAAGAFNPLNTPLLYGPAPCDDGSPTVVLTLASSHASPPLATALEILTAFCELAADFQRRSALRHLQSQRQRQQAIEDFAVHVHRPADVEATAYAIVNEGRRLIGCDRVSLVTIKGGQPRTRAVSGVDALERRGATLRMLETLAQGVARIREPVHLHRDQSSGAADLVEVAESYRDISLARRLDALPLYWQPRTDEQQPRALAVLVLEWFTVGREVEEVDDATIESVRRLSETALSNALTLEDIPWGASWRRFTAWLAPRAERREARAAAIVAAVAGLILAGMLIPAELTVSARGRLQPVERRAIFAPADGVVTNVLVDHGSHVSAKQPLLQLENTELALEVARLTGELATAEQQLRSVRAERWSETQAREKPAQDASQLAAQEESLVALVASLTAQRELAIQQQNDLTVPSPIAGNVVTWRVTELLMARPVARGQELLTVAAETGPWQLELDVPDRQIRQILEAQQSGQTTRDVTFRLATEPGVTYQGQLRKVAGATQVREGAQLVTPVEVDFDKRQVANLRPGAEVTARIHCGKRAIAYVWLHEIWEWLTARIW